MAVRLDLSAEAAKERVSDRVRLNQALSNLVKNAILHSGGRTVTIAYAEADGPDGGRQAIWSVTDDGADIPEADRPRLFLPFSRMIGATSARTDGSGLGLYVTRSVVELLGGTVRYEAPTKGVSRLIVSLALSAPTAKARFRALVRGRRSTGRNRFASRAIVEDSDLIGELLVARLRRLVAEVEWAKSGSEGLMAFERMRPDVVVTDLFISEMDGYEMTTTLRATGAKGPSIGMTAAANGEERNRFGAAGTDTVLTKPVSTTKLVEILARAVGSSAEMRDSLR